MSKQRAKNATKVEKLTDSGVTKDDVVTAPPIDVEELQQKIDGNEDVYDKLEAALSNQEAQTAEFKKLLADKARLQKHHDDMKRKYEEINAEREDMKAEIETFIKLTDDQREHIRRLEVEIIVMKESHGGNQVIKDLQDRLVRMSNDQEEKDKHIHDLEDELRNTKETIKHIENGNMRFEQTDSKSCVVM